MNENTEQIEQPWSDDMVERAGTFGHGEWMSGFLNWIDENGGTLQPQEGKGLMLVTMPALGLSCTVKPLEAYTKASPEEQPMFLVLDNITFDTKKLLEAGEPLPFGLNYEGETVQSAMQKLKTDDTTEHLATGDGRISFFLDDARVVELTFSEDGRIINILVSRLFNPIDFRSEVVYENEENAYQGGGEDYDDDDENDEEEDEDDDDYEDDEDYDDENDNENGEMNFVTACAVYLSHVFVVVQSDDNPDALCFYGLKSKQEQTILGVKSELTQEPEQPWKNETTDLSIEKATVYAPREIKSDNPDDYKYIAMITESGDVLLYQGNKIKSQETIPDVRAYGNWSFLSNIQQIGDYLYACGSFGQVYKRFGENDWRHTDNGLLQKTNVEYTDLLKLYVVNGPNENAIYAAGSINDKKQIAKAFFYDGNNWKELKLPKEAGFITDIYVESEEKIWMCGDKGTLLFGNAKKGFKTLSDAYTHRYFSNICLFKGVMYIASDRGLLAYKQGGLFGSGKIEPVNPPLENHIHDLHTITARNGAIWFVGEEIIVRFDGKQWTSVYPGEES